MSQIDKPRSSASSTPAPVVSGQPADRDGSCSLAVVVVSYNVRDLLAACLTATYASLQMSPELKATVWVVDNASVDGSAAMVAAEFPDVRLIPSPANLGFAGGNNLALKALGFRENRPQVQGAPQEEAARLGFWGRMGLSGENPDLVLLLNPDAEPVADAIGQMAQFLIRHPDVGGAGAPPALSGRPFPARGFRFPGSVSALV